MIPFLLPMWESEATARATAEQSVASNVTDADTASLLTGVEISLEAEVRGPMSQYGIVASGAYARAFDLSLSDGGSTPTDSLSAELGTYGDWVLSPFVDLSLDASGYLATQLGVRAGDTLASRDPFLRGNRLQYTVGGGPGLSVVLSRRSGLHLEAGYEQAGALAADDPSAVGVDAHTVRVGFSTSHEISDVDTLSPELTYEYAHLYHALLDVNLRRGPADIHTGTALLSEEHQFSRRLTARIGGGVTVATPPPMIDTPALTVAPAARIGLEYTTKGYRLSAGYAYEYTSLGPRIGFGQEHSATAEVSFRPVHGSRYRDFLITGQVRLARGTTPVAADPPLAEEPGMPPPSLEGSVTTTTAIAGVGLEYPLLHGLVVLGGLDLELLHATRDPEPPGDPGGSSLQTIWTVGIAGTLSTDRENTVRRDPEAGEDRREPPAEFNATRNGVHAQDHVEPLRDAASDTDAKHP